jgi:hypothetical protein
MSQTGISRAKVRSAMMLKYTDLFSYLNKNAFRVDLHKFELETPVLAYVEIDDAILVQLICQISLIILVGHNESSQCLTLITIIIHLCHEAGANPIK